MLRLRPQAPVVAVGAVIRDNAGRVLLIRRGQAPAKGRYSLPGGGVELGETVKDACRREVKEETGLDVEVGRLIDVIDRVVRNPAGEIEYHYVICDFEATVTGGTLTVGDDAAEACWVAFTDLDALPLSDGLAEFLRK